MKRLLFVFLDGVGLGPPGPANPFTGMRDGAFDQLAGGQGWLRELEGRSTADHYVGALDATLGIDGLPQSGTGQATLLTGHNCAATVGRHFGPYPHSSTHTLLDTRNVFRQIAEQPGLPPSAFANAFPPRFFEATSRRDTVTTRACRSAGVPLRGPDALRDGRAVAADLTGRAWREHFQLETPLRSEADAAAVLANLTRNHSLTFFEYFLTDKVGHKRSSLPPATLLSSLDAFFSGLLDHLTPSREALLITSDHGNLEDTSHTQHTRNPVPLIVVGWAAPFFASATSLTDVTPAIMTALRDAASAPSS